jgi:hypothetical protein
MAKGKVEGNTSKRKMVEEALKEKGNVGPKEIHEFILSKYKTDMSLQMISSYKSNLKKTSGGGVSLGVQSVDVKDITTIQAMLSRMSKDQLIGMVKLLAKN